MTIEIKQSTTTHPLVFMMVDSTDHVTGKTGLSPTVTISKAGAAFASPAGAVTEIAHGWYKVAGNATDNATLGPLILHATGTAADPVDVVYNVTARLVDDLATPTNITAGTITTVTTLTNLPAITSNWLTAAGIAAGALDGKGNWNIGKTGYSLTAATGLGNQTANITGNITGSVGSVTGLTASDVGAIKTKTDFLPSVVAGDAGGVFIAGTNAPVTITGSGDALTLTSTGGNGHGLNATGNGTGYGGVYQGGATGAGLRARGGSTSGNGFEISGPTNGHGLNCSGSGADKSGIAASGVGTGESHGIFTFGSAAGHGLFVQGLGTGDGIKATSVTGSPILGNITGNLSGTIGGLTAGALADLFDTNSGTTYASAVAGSVVKEIADNAGGSGLTVAAIADGVWDELLAGHAISGSAGEALSAAGTAGDPWVTALPGAYGAGTAGNIVGNRLDVAVSTRSTYAGGAVASVTGNVGGNVTGSVGSVVANVTFGNTSIATVTNLTNLPAAAALEATLTAMKGATFAGATDSLEALRDRGDAAWATATGFATPTNITAGTLTTVTNLTNLPTIPANWLTAAGTAADFTTEIQTGLATAAALATVDGIVDAILLDTAEIGTAGAGLTNLGTVSADVVSISGSTVAADNLEESTEVIGTGTCAAAGSTTTVIASAITPTSAVNDQYNGRVIIFKGNVTAALAGQATTISDYVHATLTFTVVALTTAPASGDLFTIL